MIAKSRRNQAKNNWGGQREARNAAFGYVLKMARYQAGLSQSQVTQKFESLKGKKRSTMTNLEAGLSTISIELFMGLAQLYEMDPVDLFNRGVDMYNHILETNELPSLS